jgi:hypothetical protein
MHAPFQSQHYVFEIVVFLMALPNALVERQITLTAIFIKFKVVAEKVSSIVGPVVIVIILFLLLVLMIRFILIWRHIIHVSVMWHFLIAWTRHLGVRFYMYVSFVQTYSLINAGQTASFWPQPQKQRFS